MGPLCGYSADYGAFAMLRLLVRLGLPSIIALRMGITSFSARLFVVPAQLADLESHW